MRTAPRLLLLSLIAVAMPTARAGLAAQNATLRFRHTAAKPQTFQFVAPGSRDTVEVSEGADLEVLERAKLCVKVWDSNPLFYQYALKATEIPLQMPPALTDFLGAFAKLQAALPPGRMAMERQDPVRARSYEALVLRIVKALAAVEEFKRQSVTRGFGVVYPNAMDSLHVADLALKEARELIGTPNPADPNDQIRLLAAEALGNHLAQAMQEWKGAHARSEQLAADGECVDGGPQDMQLSFTIAAVPNTKPEGRFVGKVFENITTDVTSRQLIVGAVGVLWGFFTGVDTFTVTNGVVDSGSKSQNPLRPAAFLYLRPTWRWPVWTTIGIGTGDDITYPDVFLGVSWRIGGNVSTPLVTIGAGAMWSAFPTKLGNGARVGEPLPDTIKNLSEATGYDRQWGFGVHLTIFGFDLVAGKPTGKKDDK